MNTQIIPFTSTQFDEACIKIRAAGLEIDGNSGDLRHSGCRVHYEFSPTLKQLTLTVLEKPRLVGVSYVFNRIRKALGVVEE